MNALTSNEYAAVLTWLLAYRSEAMELEDCRIGALRSALKGADEKAKELSRALASAHENGQGLHNLAVSRAQDIARLEHENAQLKAALAEARTALPKVVKVAVGDICRKVVELQDRKIDCIKLIRNEKSLVDDGSGDPIALRLAKDIFELVGAAEGVTCSVPSRVNIGHYINGCTSYYNLKREVEAVVKAYYPTCKVELASE